VRLERDFTADLAAAWPGILNVTVTGCFLRSPWRGRLARESNPLRSARLRTGDLQPTALILHIHPFILFILVNFNDQDGRSPFSNPGESPTI
jgi:hypothetical protein